MEPIGDTIDKALAGDRVARERLGHWLRELLLRSFSRRFGRVNAEDLVHETIADVYAALHRAPRDEVGFTRWVQGFGRNERREMTAAEQRELDRAQLHSAHAQTLPTPPGMDALFASQEKLQRVLALLNELSEEQRQVLLARLAGYPFAHIAAALGISESTARSRASLARQRIRARWETERRTASPFRS